VSILKSCAGPTAQVTKQELSKRCANLLKLK